MFVSCGNFDAVINGRIITVRLPNVAVVSDLNEFKGFTQYTNYVELVTIITCGWISDDMARLLDKP